MGHVRIVTPPFHQNKNISIYLTLSALLVFSPTLQEDDLYPPWSIKLSQFKLIPHLITPQETQILHTHAEFNRH